MHTAVARLEFYFTARAGLAGFVEQIVWKLLRIRLQLLEFQGRLAGLVFGIESGCV